MDNNINAINSSEQNEHKWWLLERIRISGKKVLAPVLAAGSISLWWLPAATIPATWAAVATVLTACSDDEPDNPNDTVAPTVNVSQHDVDITWWKQVRVNWNQLYIWDALVASRTDNVTKNCTVELSLNWKTISSWTIINEWWYLTVKVRDEAGNTKTIDIKLTMNNQLISWLENLQNLSMQVDQEVNLLNWITFWNGASLVKVEIEMDWQTTQITDPNHYTPQYPWQCTIILTVKDKNGNIVTEKVNKNIQALEYKEPTINTVDILEKYPWYAKLKEWTKNFLYPHILISIASSNRSEQPDRRHIIMWETAEWVENIWQSTTPSEHGTSWYRRIRNMAPNVKVLWCRDYRRNLENYLNNHTDKFYIISCAADAIWWSNLEQLNNNSATAPLRRILEMPNVIVVIAWGNQTASWWIRKVYSENISNWNYYNGWSINGSKYHNKITATWYDSRNSDKNYFSPNYKTYWWLESNMPVGYQLEKNIVMPSTWWSATFEGYEDYYTTSSCPTAMIATMTWNVIDIIKSNHSGISLAETMDILVNNYLRREKIRYKDENTNGNVVDSEYFRYFIDAQKIIENELLHISEIENIQFKSWITELPNNKWICYTGKWIMFEYNGQSYEASEKNQSILKQWLMSWNITKRYWDSNKSKKQWDKNPNFKVFVVDKKWEMVPSTQRNISKTIN